MPISCSNLLVVVTSREASSLRRIDHLLNGVRSSRTPLASSPLSIVSSIRPISSASRGNPTASKRRANMKRFETIRVANLAQPHTGETAWLIEGLWSAQAVGIIGGEPKCGKSFLALDLAAAVASGTPCLRRFPTRQRGAVLLYAAEDAAHIVRQRLEGIAHAASVDFGTLDVHVITAPTLRLDQAEHQQVLRATVA